MTSTIADRRKSSIHEYTTEVDAVQFYIMSDKEIETDARQNVNLKEIYSEQNPVPRGVYDGHLGSTGEWKCATCGDKQLVCPGHFGEISLNYPVKAPMFITYLYYWLRIVCHECGKLHDEKKIRNNKGHYRYTTRYTKPCWNCGAIPVVILHQPKQHQTKLVINDSKNNEPREFLNDEICDILERITDETVSLLGYNPELSHPRRCMWKKLRVPPNTIRPEQVKQGMLRRANSDMNSFLLEIVGLNNKIPKWIPSNENIRNVSSQYNLLDVLVYEFLVGSSESSELQVLTNMKKKPMCLMNRLLGKEARIRLNLMGRRVVYMTRSVISGDNYLKLNEIGISKDIAQTVQIEETVREYNRNRLQTYFNNKCDRYPGCTKIKKVSDGTIYRVDLMKSDYILQNGDVIHRDVISGDYVNFNRQPSLLICSVSGMRVRVLDHSVMALKQNVSSCYQWNSDFDGDEMTVWYATTLSAMTEIMIVSAFQNFLISYKAPFYSVGNFQDSLLVCPLFTKHGVELDRWHAMFCLGQNTEFYKDLKMLAPETIPARDCVSMMLPNISIRGKPKMFLEQFKNQINYHPKDIDFCIENGHLKSGIIDKKFSGQARENTIFHNIHKFYGAKKSMNAVYSFQQLLARFVMFRGFSVGLNDFILDPKLYEEIDQVKAEMYREADLTLEMLDAGTLVPPLGSTIEEYYERRHQNDLHPGEAFLKTLLKYIKIDENNMLHLVWYSKGTPNHFGSMNISLGTQLVDGCRMLNKFNNRTLPFFQKYDYGPEAKGYIDYSYFKGIPARNYPAAAGEGRHATVTNALSTANSGTESRIAIKNHESLVTNHLHGVSRGDRVIQPLYGCNGIDPTKICRVYIDHIRVSDKEFEKIFRTTGKEFSEHKKLFDREFEQLKIDRKLFRKAKLVFERSSCGNNLFDGEFKCAFDLGVIIKIVRGKYTEHQKKHNVAGTPARKRPVEVLKLIANLCENLVYSYRNLRHKRLQLEVPEYLRIATVFSCIYIRNKLCFKRILEEKLTVEMVQEICLRVEEFLKNNLIDAGTSVGIIMSQCIAEPLVQANLDAKHKVGVGASKVETNPMQRLKEISGAFPTSKMQNPSCTVYLREDIEDDKEKVIDILNRVSMLTLGSFASSYSIHYKETDNTVIRRFMREYPDAYTAGDLLNWSIMFTLDEAEMLEKGINISDLTSALNQNYYGQLMFAGPPVNHDLSYIVVFVQKSMFPKQEATSIPFPLVQDLALQLLNALVYGIENIEHAFLYEQPKTYIDQKTGEVKSKIIYCFKTMGSNLRYLRRVPVIDKKRTQSNSILEMYFLHGIHTAKYKIMLDIVSVLESLNYIHASLYAMEMTNTGSVVNIRRSGLGDRDKHAIFLRMSFGFTKKTIREAAINGSYDQMSDISSELMCGQIPKIGTMYSETSIDEQFLRKALAETKPVYGGADEPPMIEYNYNSEEEYLDDQLYDHSNAEKEYFDGIPDLYTVVDDPMCTDQKTVNLYRAGRLVDVIRMGSDSEEEEECQFK